MLQLDVWTSPSASPLRPKITILSHTHRDHIPQSYDTVVVHQFWADRVRLGRPVIANGEPVTFSFGKEKLTAKALSPRDVSRLIGERVRRLHCTWWLVNHKNGSETTMLFIGDMDAGEAEIVKKLIETLERKGVRLDKVALPSYNGVNGHGAKHSRQLAEEVADLTRFARAKGIRTVALPHPVVGPGEWDEVWTKPQ